MNKIFSRIIRVIVLAGILVSAFGAPVEVAHAAAELTITPITWNVIGLDSNRPADGPNEFPVGVRACNPVSNAVTFTDVEADFVWLAGGTSEDDTYIKLRPGSLETIAPDPQVDLDPGDCYDFYFEVELAQVAGAFDQTRRYRIDVDYFDPDAGSRQTVNSPIPRELYVEYLISQSRNSVIDVELDFASVPVGGVMDLMIGETYTISMDASTATQGYEQIKSFIHFPNTIFQILSVNSLYSADSSVHVPNPNDKLYGDSCLWENDPDNPNYRSCLDVGKNGGTVRVDYVVKIISGAGTSGTLNSLIYDFSGSSYHYNADFAVSYRTYNIIGPSSIEIAKRFVPDSIVTGDDSSLTITLTNPSSSALVGVKFDDPLPVGMTVTNPVVSSTNGCGTPTFSPVGGANSFSFSGGTIAPNSSCLIKVDVTVASDGSYLNTTGNLFINDTVDTGNNASATLTAGAAQACTPGQTMAIWTVPATTTNPPDQSSPATGSPTTTGSKIPAATVGLSDPSRSDIEIASGEGDTYSWKLWGFKTPVQNVDFVIDTSSYSEVSMGFFERTDSNGPDTLTIYYDSGAGITPHPIMPAIAATVGPFTAHTVDFTGLTDPGGNTTFRISGTGALNDQSGANLFLDQITFTGCLESDPPPTISKAFGTDPIRINNDESTLTFTIANTDAAAVDLTGIKFSDTLPSGLEVSTTPDYNTTCLGSPTWAPSSGDTILTFGDPSGLSLTAGNNCTASVDIMAVTAGFFENISGYISADQSGENKTSTGYATDTITVVVPPVISKAFSDAEILVGDSTSLNFTITNLNQFTDFTGVSFTDTLPGGLDAVSPGVSGACGGFLSVLDDNPDNISLIFGSVPAASSCTFSIPLIGSTAGQQDNITSAVLSIEGGPGNTASASIFVKAPTPDLNILKQIGFGSDPDGSWAKSLRIDSLPTDVYYKFIVENVGDVDLTSIRVFDPPSDYPTSPVSCTFYEPTEPATLFVEPLQAGEYIYCVTGPVTVSDPGSNTNTAVAYGTYSTVDYVSDPASSAYYGTPAISMAKSAAENYFAVVGDSITYSYLVTNSGYIDLEGPVAVTDDTVSVTCPYVNTVGDNDNYLDVGESLTCTASYTVDQDDLDAGSVTNNAIASVVSVTSASDSVTVPYAAYTISKTVLDVGGDGAGGSVDAAGDEIDYRVVVTNTGNYPLTGISLGDTLVAGVGLPTESGTADNILEIGETWIWEFSYTALQADLDNNGGGDGDIDNIAFVSSTQLAAQSASAAVPVAQSPALTLVKVLIGYVDHDFSGDISLGDDLSFTITMTNTGNVTLTSVDVSDGDLTPSSNNCPSVAPGGTCVLTGSYEVDQTDVDAGSFTNTGVVTDDDVCPGAGAGVCESSVTTPIAQDASLTVEKSSTALSLSAPGTVTYDYLVTNTGNVTITGLSLSDDNDENDMNCGSATIPVGGTTTCTATHTFTQAELDAGGNLSNTVTASSNEAPDATDDLDISITQNPSITVEKSSVTGGLSAPATVTYDYLVTNTGNVTITGLSLSDDNDNDDMSCGSATIAVGGTTTCSATHTFTQAELDAGGNLSNTVTASSNEAPDATDDLDISITQNPSITVEKSSVTGGLSAPGTVTYDYLVTNTGNVTITGLSLSDDNDNDDMNCGSATIAVGGTTTCTATHTFTQGELDADGSPTPGSGNLSNTVTASSNEAPDATDDLDISITQNPSITVEKSSVTGGLIAPELVTYDYLVTNTGNVTITGLTLSDDNDQDDMVCALSVIPVGSTTTCTATHDFTQAELDANGSLTPGSGNLSNTVTASSNEAPDATDDLDIPIVQDTDLSLSKVYDGYTDNDTSGDISVGDDLNFTITMTNEGSVTLTNVLVSDPDLTPGSNSCLSVAPGGTCVLTGSYEVVQGDVDAGSFDNTAVVTDDDVCPGAGALVCESSVTTPITQNPSITVEKSSVTGGLSAPGTVTYDYLVTNTGNVTITGLSLSDDNDEDDMNCGSATIPVGGTTTCTATHTFTQAELDADGSLTPGSGNLSNTVTASSNEAPDATDDLDIPITQNPSITVEKSSTTLSLSAPGTVTYDYLVTNTGNVTITGLSLSDDNDEDDMNCGSATIPVGGTTTCTATHTFTQAELDADGSPTPGSGNLSNTVTASSNEAPDATDDLDIPIVQNASLTVEKTSTTLSLIAPELVTYDYLVTNTGNVTITGLSLSDDNDEDDMNCGSATIPVGGTTTCTATHTFTQAELDADGSPTPGSGNLSNTVTASSNEAPDATDDLDIPITQNRDLSLGKVYIGYTDHDFSGDISVGDDLIFTITMTNTGSVTLTDVTVTDPQLTPGSNNCPSVAPGGTCVLTGSYEVVQGDVDAGSFDNTAVVTDDDVCPGAGALVCESSVMTPIAQDTSLTVEKTSTTLSLIAPELVTYDYLVTNTGNVTITGLTLSDDNDQDDMVCALSVIPVDSTTTCTATHDFTQGELDADGSPTPGSGNLSNAVTASSNEAPDATDSLDIPITMIFDPPYGIKTFDDAGLPVLEWTMVWINNANTVALDVVINDPIPTDTTYRLGTLSCEARGSSVPDPGTCTYDFLTETITWEGSIGPDLGANNEDDADNEVVITFQVDIPEDLDTSENTAVLDADLNRNGVIDPDTEEIEAAEASATWERSSIPETGFLPGSVTNIPAQPANQQYQQLGSVWLEVPRLGIKTNIVGVPRQEGTWDVTWLSNQVGWLDGSAFPSYAGNSVLTAHVYLPSGYPGPFVDLSQLSWNDRIVVHAYGQQYIYQVRTNRIIRPDDPSAFGHEEYPWLTLLTCKGYNESTGSYDYRVMIRAVQVDILPDN